MSTVSGVAGLTRRPVPGPAVAGRHLLHVRLVGGDREWCRWCPGVVASLMESETLPVEFPRPASSPCPGLVASVCAGRCGVSRDVSSGGPGGAEAGEVVSLSRRETLRRLLIGGGVVASASLLTVAPAAASLTTPRQVRGYRYVGTRYFTSSGTFAKANPLGTGDVGCRAVRVRVVGAGGGGGGAAATGAAQASAGGGGGGGAFAESFILASALPTSVTVTRGAGGVGGAAGANAGSAGGASEFGAGEAFEVSAAGGLGGGAGFARGTPDYCAAGGEGNTFVGDFGSNGNSGLAVLIAPDLTSIARPAGGAAAAFSGSGSSGRLSAGGNGIVGNTRPGGGGGGGCNIASQASARSGGTGQNGVVIVEVYA
jgi:hypothetical protein